MSGDPMKLVKFVCVAQAHAAGRSDSALTIHDGTWAFCPTGADGKGHDWKASDGLPLTDALRFTPRQQASGPVHSTPARPATPAPSAPARGGARPR
jgi:hypothetical protein